MMTTLSEPILLTTLSLIPGSSTWFRASAAVETAQTLALWPVMAPKSSAAAMAISDRPS